MALAPAGCSPAIPEQQAMAEAPPPLTPLPPPRPPFDRERFVFKSLAVVILTQLVIYALAAGVSVENQFPEDLFEAMSSFIGAHPDWDQYRVITSALAGFLFQNGCSDRCVSQHYLNGLFMKTGE